MLLDRLTDQKDFTSAEKHIADTILSNLETFANPSMEELAQLTNTSKPTIVRLCKKLNQNSYQQFRDTLSDEISELKRINTRISNEPITASTTYEDLNVILPVLYDSIISNTKIGLDKMVLSRVIKKINRANHVDIYGTGITHTAAELAAFKFSTLGIGCSVFSGVNEHYVMANQELSDTVSLIFSFTGGNSTMIDAACWLKKRKAYTVGIGGNFFSGLRQSCTDYIDIQQPSSEKSLLGLEVLTAFTSINYIVDFLFTSLMVERYDRIVNASIQVAQHESEKAPNTDI